MNTVFLDFNTRAKEVNDYFIFLERLEKQTTKLAVFEREELFSGNVDARLIKEIADKYGFSYQTDFAKTKNGQNLVAIKSNRNDLAHGIKSFEEVGRDKTIKQLLEIKEEVVEYLTQILENIRDYLDNEEYLELPTGNP
jgi:MAE_28990/MAE_18760-like HEPN